MAQHRGSELEGDSPEASTRDTPEASTRDTPGASARDTGPRDEKSPGAQPPPPGLPEGIRRLIGLGLSGVFSTQETLRQAVGDALPKEWVDYVASQSDRTRAEFLERLAGELARTIESIDLARVMQQALEGRTLEVHARIRMLPDEDGQGGGLRITMKEDEEQ